MKSFVVFVSVFLVNVLTCTGYEYIEEGSNCQQFGISGICKQVKDCPEAITSLQSSGKHNFLRCGFVGVEEVVCCPNIADRSPKIETTTIDEALVWEKEKGDNAKRRISERQCKRYIKKYNISTPIEFHITNGENAKVGEFPHMAGIFFEDDDDETILTFRCGATLIAPRWALSAAHCMVCTSCSPPKKLRFGVVAINAPQLGQDVDVKDFTPHPNYHSITKQNDIALLELMTDVKMTPNIRPACLYSEPDDPKILTITGWGNTLSGTESSFASILQKAQVNSVPVNECNVTIVEKIRFSSKVVLATQVCAISKSDSCPGDSGGPIQIEKDDGTFHIVGVISYGINCGSNIPGIYTRVYSYLDWIEGIVWPKKIKT